jgi:thioredoxin
MKKTAIIFAAAAFLTLSCNNGSATSIEQSDKGNSKLASSAVETSLDGQTHAAGKTIHLNKQDFLKKVMNYEKNQSEWVYEGDLPALIDFYADWCGPCRMAAPILEELAKEYEGKIYIYKVDTEKERELAGVFGIRSLPSFLFVPQDGRPTMSNGIAQTTEQTKLMFKQMIDQILLGQKSDQL